MTANLSRGSAAGREGEIESVERRWMKIRVYARGGSDRNGIVRLLFPGTLVLPEGMANPEHAQNCKVKRCE